MRQALYEGNHPLVAEALASVGVAYEKLGNYEQALTMRQALYEGNHPLVAEALASVG